MICPLCNTPDCAEIARDKNRAYAICGVCGLVFVPSDYHVSIDQEKLRYELHDNSAGDEKYVRYITEVADILGSHCRPGSRILDFGCGKNAVLAGMLRQRGFDCMAYDPLYCIGQDALGKKYGAVVMCEVIEHLRDLKGELGKIGRVLDGGTKIFIRTQLCPPIEAFNGWWYKNDCTHVNFLSEKSLDFVASMLGLTVGPKPINGVFLLTKGR